MDQELTEQFNESMRQLSEMMAQLNSTMAGTVKSMNDASAAGKNAAATTTQSAASQANSANQFITDNTKIQQAQQQASSIMVDSAKNFAKAGEQAGYALKGFVSSMLSSEEGFKKYGNALGTLGDSALSLGSNFGLLGGAAGLLLKGLTSLASMSLQQVDTLVKYRDETAKVTGVIPTSLERIAELGSKAGYAGERLLVLQRITGGLGTSLQGLGETAGRGQERFLELADVTEKTRRRFGLMGVSQEALTDLQGKYVKLQEASGNQLQMQTKTTAQLRKESLQYVENIIRLSDMTGKQADQIAKEQELVQMQFEEQTAVAAENARIAELRSQTNNKAAQDEAKSLEAQRDARQKVTNTIAAVFDPKMAMQVGRVLRTGFFDDKSGALAPLYSEIIQYANRIKNVKPGQDTDRMTKDLLQYMMNSAKSGINMFQVPLQVQGEEFGNQVGLYRDMIIQMNKYGNMSVDQIYEKIKADEAKAQADAKKAQDEQDRREAEIKVQRAYQDAMMALSDITLPLLTSALNFLSDHADDVTGIMKWIGEKLKDAFEWFSKPENRKSLEETFTKVGSALTFLYNNFSTLATIVGVLAGVTVLGSLINTIKTVTGALSLLSGAARLGPAAAAAGQTAAGAEAAAAAGGTGIAGMLGPLLAGGAIAGSLGWVGNKAVDYAEDKGALDKQQGGWAKVLADAGAGAAGGAAFGALGGGIGAVPGALIGGAGGLAYGLYDNWGNLWGKGNEPARTKQGAAPNKSKKEQSPPATKPTQVPTQPKKEQPHPSKTASITDQHLLQQRVKREEAERAEKNEKEQADANKKFSSSISQFSDSIRLLSTLVNSEMLAIQAFSRSVADMGSKILDMKAAINTFFNAVDKFASSVLNTGSTAPAPSLSGTSKDMQEYLAATALTESQGNPNAKAKTSSAGGLFQFTDQTWQQTVREMGKNYSLQDKFDPAKATEVAKFFAEKQKTYIERAIGRPATATDMYMAHFLGQGGAARFLTAMDEDPNTAAASIVGAKAANANKNIFFDKQGKARTLQDVYNLMGEKIGKGITAVRTGKWAGGALPKSIQDMLAQAPNSSGMLKDNIGKLFNLGGGVTGNIQNLDNLDPGFESALVKALTEYKTKTGKTPTITSGFRYPGDQRKISSGGNPKAREGMSRHERGLAMDLDSSSVSEMNRLGILDRYGLRGGQASSARGNLVTDPPHVELKARNGGVFAGSTQGYPVTLHGTEMIAPLNLDSVLMKLAKTPAGNTEGQELLGEVKKTAGSSTADVDKISLFNKEVASMITTKLDKMIDILDDGNNTRHKILQHSR